MTAQTKTVLKSYFETGDTPTQAQFEDLIDTIPGALGAIADGDIPASIARDSEVAASYRPITEKSQVIFTIEGSLAVGSGTIRIRNRTGRTLTISEVHCEVNTAPVGAAIIVDIHKNGTTIFTTQSNRPQIADGANAGNSTTIEAPSWANDTYLTMDRDQVGSGTAGSDLVVTVVYS